MNIKINKPRKLPKYYRNKDHCEIYANVMPDLSYHHIYTPAKLQKLYSADYIFDSVVEFACIGKEVNNYISIEVTTLERSAHLGCYSQDFTWKYKFIKPITMYSTKFEYLYIILIQWT